MILTGRVLAALIAVAIIFIGLRFLWAPATASRGYGIPDSALSSKEIRPWLTVKGVRDIASGLFVFLLMAHGSPRLLGEFLLVASLIPIGDAFIVIRAGGSRGVAFGIHGCTALFMIVSAAVLIGAHQ